MFSAYCRSRVSLSNSMKTVQSLFRFECIRIQSRNYAIQHVLLCLFTHPESGHTGGSRLANIPNAEDSTTAACCYPVTASAPVSATLMMSLAFPSSYSPRLSIDRQRTFQVHQIFPADSPWYAYYKSCAFTHTVFTLNVSQEL